MPVTDATVPYRTRLWVVFASHARTAVILRRGPRKHFHLISWDLNRDTFTHGQWMRGFVRLWDLSPNGEYLVYWAHQYHPTAYWRRSQLAQRDPAARASYDPMVADRQRRSPTKLRKRRKVPRYLRQQTVRPAKQLRKNEGVWTAISRPPYFTALAIWPSFGHWTGGGTFRTDNFLVLNEGPDDLDAIENVRMPNRFSVHSYRDFAAHQQWPLFSARHGWQGDPMVKTDVSLALYDAGASWIDWIVVGDEGDLLFSCDGCVYRLSQWRRVAPGAYLTEARQLADFRDLTFVEVPPSQHALQW